MVIPMYDELIARIRYHIRKADFMGLKEYESTRLLNEAADAIERLDAIAQTYAETVHEIEDKRKWIPVTERLPETRDYVLCCGAKGGMFVGYVSCFTEPQGSAWAWQHGGQGRKIKWWMPLPQPPESEGVV